jgi:hypothetical protein
MVPVWWQGLPVRYDAVGAADWGARVAIATLSVLLAGLGLRGALLVDPNAPAGRARRLGRRRAKLRRLRRGV